VERRFLDPSEARSSGDGRLLHNWLAVRIHGHGELNKPAMLRKKLMLVRAPTNMARPVCLRPISSLPTSVALASLQSRAYASISNSQQTSLKLKKPKPGTSRVMTTPPIEGRACPEVLSGKERMMRASALDRRVEQTSDCATTRHRADWGQVATRVGRELWTKLESSPLQLKTCEKIAQSRLNST